MTNQEVREGRCVWCRQTDEGGETVTWRGHWWHRDCAEENLSAVEEALA